jgi:hypothetical protein
MRKGVPVAAGMSMLLAGALLFGERPRIASAPVQHGVAPRAASGPDGRTEPVLVVPRVSAGERVPTSIHGERLRALSPGDTLRIAGSDAAAVYAVRIESNVAEPGGNRSIVGRVVTALGVQAMVITVGRDAVFAILPRPDGSQLRIESVRGQAFASIAGGMTPGDGSGGFGVTDAIEPPMPALALRGVTPPAPRSRPKAGGAEVRIDVLVLVSSELAELRGSASAAETDAINLFAAVRLAFVDSGTLVRLNASRYASVPVSGTPSHSNLLSTLQRNTLTGVDVDALRTENAADLVAMIRPRPPNDVCGIAFLNGHEFSAGSASPEYGYSVSSVGQCTPHVLAHELGHNLGSSHERDQYLASGRLQYGAYPFSFGYRQGRAPAFATVMAYSQGEPHLGVYSDPASRRCGAPCGVVDESDNVASLDLMAPVIAAFRGAPGTLSLHGMRQYEGDPDYPGRAYFIARLSGRAPEEGITFRVEAAGGTAIAGVDYEIPTNEFQIPKGQREALVPVELHADRVVEADESIRLRLVSVTGAPVDQVEAESLIVDDDPRHPVSGRLILPPGMPAPALAPTLSLCHSETAGCGHALLLKAPDFAFSFGAVDRMPQVIEVYFQPTDPYVGSRRVFAPVRGPLTVDIHAEPAIELSGRVAVPPDGPSLEGDLRVTITHAREGRVSYAYATARAPDYRFEAYVAPRSWVTVHVAPPPPYRSYQHVDTLVPESTEWTIALEAKPRLALWIPPTEEERPQGAIMTSTVIVALQEPAPAGGVKLDYRIVDGTARAGLDFVATRGTVEIAAGQRSGYIEVELLADETFEGEETFFVELSNVVGAAPTAPRYRFWIIDAPRRTGGALPPEAAP